MTNLQKFSILILRLSLGFLMFYAGVTKVTDPSWSAAGYIKGAKAFIPFYNFILSPSVLPVINFLNEWGLTLLGISLIFGVFVRLSSALGIILMILYYLPILKFPYAGDHSYLVDEHVIYSSALLLLIAFSAGRIFGLDGWFAKFRK
ncbi:MAG: DoxX family protein [Patescibacteria group bacterium]|nr:DoxX family protein [Patescibacteria group bacterium]MDE1988592.1 DoxX family protein [Patescibacteria group bacterium]MDE2217950.1 DoxX family protein [Patescibacteria group bacterium]